MTRSDLLKTLGDVMTPEALDDALVSPLSGYKLIYEQVTGTYAVNPNPTP